MKLILSRKGFDSSYGGVPSPILPTGELISLPIPDHAARRSYQEIRADGQPLGPLVRDLTRGRLGPADTAHLDPDLNPESVARQPGWRPVFGQAGAAEAHLQRLGVGQGDLFLFFGWFRRVEWAAGRYRYVPGAPDLHVLFGWLQVGRHIPLEARHTVPPWARDHPHYAHTTAPDGMYLAAERLTLDGYTLHLPGAGRFAHFRPELCLTAPGAARSTWLLPAWFHPGASRPPLTYHQDPHRWQLRDGYAWLQSATRGQEFVLDCDCYPEAVAWVAELLVWRQLTCSAMAGQGMSHPHPYPS